jgi:predicted enzyme related to lactoylglutathione lyase
MERPKAGAVLFAKDHISLTRFYVEAFGLTALDRGDDHAVLGCEGFRLVVHQIPADAASGVKIDTPPRRREGAAIKLCFAVESLERVRRTVAALGGTLDPSEAEWTDSESTTCKGHDPEGNVFNVFVYRVKA